MKSTFLFQWLCILSQLTGLLTPQASVQSAKPQRVLAQNSSVTAYDLIIAMNTLRMSYGLPALIEDPIIDAVAQSTAEYMAANQMSWHIGNVSGRIQAAGYGGGSKVWATENFATGFNSLDEIMQVWSDASHMLPAVVPAYCNVGAGVAVSPNGMTYYILQAAYTADKACGAYTSPGGATLQPGGMTGISQAIVPVKIATPDADGKIFHVVEAGQSFWAIAIAYKITIKDIEVWNNLSRDSKLQIGQRLFIPGANTTGYATPTPMGMVQTNTPDADGRVVHVVQAYQSLTTIAQAYGVKIDTILVLNGIQVDWPLQIGQKLIIHPGTVTPSATSRPLTPLEKLTPENDGKYYYIVKSGDTLLWIAGLYEVTLADLMAWNRLTISTILQPGQKLLLQVTPPATITFTATTTAPVTPTPSVTPSAIHPTPTSTPSLSPTRTVTLLAAATASSPMGQNTLMMIILGIFLTAFGLFLFVFLRRKMRK
jgi:LysM repeat protein